jgi:hypothetical protein
MDWEINLQNPAWLEVVLERYLSMGVVPAEGPPPTLLTEGTARLVLPDGSPFETKGRVIRISGPTSFLVQIDRMPDLAALRKMARAAKVQAARHPDAGGHAGSGAGVPASSALVDDLMSMVRPEHLLFQEVLDPVAPVEAPEAPRQEAPPTADWRARIDKPQPRHVPPQPPPKAVSVSDLIEESVEVEAAPPVPARPPLLSQSQSPQSQSQPRIPVPREMTFRAGTPGSVYDAPREKRELGAAGGGRAGESTVTGLETEYSDVYAKVKDLPLVEKQKLARHGRRTVRQILMRDPLKTLQRLVLSNPDIGLDEVLEYANWPALAKDALEFIAMNPTWTGSRMVVLALVKNPSTPIELAIRLVARLGPAEWRLLVRPNLVRTPVAAAARKALRTESD